MNRRLLLIFGVVVLIIIALVAWWFNANYKITRQNKWQPTQFDSSSTEAILQDYGFLALKKTLPIAHPKSDIVETSTWTGPKDSKTKTNQLVWIRENVNNVDDKNFVNFNQDLLAWIAQGNHVILPLRDAESTTAKLAALVGVSIQETDKTLVRNDFTEGRCAEEKVRYEAQLKQASVFGEGLLSVPFNFNAEEMMQACRQGLSWVPIGNNEQVALYNQYTNKQSNSYLLVSADKQKNLIWKDKSPYGSQMLSMRQGKGQITFIIDIDAFSSASLPIIGNSLDKYDHLAISNYLSNNRPNILLVSKWRSTEIPEPTSMWKKAWENTPWFVILFFVTIAMIFWHHKLPKGVRYRLHPYSNRQWQQHLLAAGQFIEERQSKEALLEEWQQQLFKHWQRRYGNWHSLSSPDKITLLKDALNLPSDVIVMWCKPIPEKLTRKEWLTYLQAYQLIRKAL